MTSSSASVGKSSSWVTMGTPRAIAVAPDPRGLRGGQRHLPIADDAGAAVAIENGYSAGVAGGPTEGLRTPPS